MGKAGGTFYIYLTIVALFSAFLFFFTLGDRSLWDPDEPRYAEAARVMIEKGDFVTPYFNNDVRFDKPPLFYWLVALAYKVFGINEFSARFFSGVFALMGVITVFILASILLDERAGLMSALILATSLEYIVLANIANTDMTFSFFIGLCLFFFFLGYMQLKGRPAWYLFSYIAMALAVLTKGPAGVILPLLVIGAFIAATRQWRLILDSWLIPGVILAALISAPWYLLILKRHGQEYSQTFFVYHNLLRFFSEKFDHREPFYYFFYVLAGGLAPWVIFLPNAIWALFRRKAHELRQRRMEWLFVFLWFLMPFLFFTASKAKLATYILPCYMPLALIIGKFWKERLFNRFAIVFAVFVLIAGAGESLPLEKLFPKLAMTRTTKSISLKVGEVIKPEETLASCGIFKPSMVFYSHHPVELIGEENAVDFLKSRQRVYCIFKRDVYDQVKDKADLPLYIVAENLRLVAVTNRSGF